MPVVRIFYLGCLALLISSIGINKSFAEKTVITAQEEFESTTKTFTPKTLGHGEFYELVHDNLRPDTDEFYVGSIFTIKGKPKALIKRSINKRASDLYINYSEYGIGDYLATGYKIKDISFSKKEVLVLEESSGEIYGLTVSYGDAKSRLTKKSVK
jgi:hypothetical protein